MADDRMKNDDLQRNMGAGDKGQNYGGQQSPGQNGPGLANKQRPANMLVVSKVVVAKKERKTWKTTRKISAPVEPDRPEVRIVAVRIAN